jgi:hypothetical protein
MIMEIHPYEYHGMLVFDDPTVGLEKEPFVQGIPEMLYKLCQNENVQNPENGFRLKFSESAFDGHQMQLKWLQEENGGNWYEAEGIKGWLCPALYKYFSKAPSVLYIMAESK